MDDFKPYIDPISPFTDNELIKYMSERIANDKVISFSDIRDLLRNKYEGLSDLELKEEKDSLFIRKIAIGSVGLENTSTIAISIMAIMVAILSIVHEKLNIIFIKVFLFSVLVSVLIFLINYEKRIIRRAREIAYCTLALEIIKEIKPEIFN